LKLSWITTLAISLTSVLFAIACGDGPSGSKEALFGPHTIAFVSTRDGNTEIYAMNPDGSGQTRLTDNSSDDYAASWSPDGEKIAFSSYLGDNDEIHVMNADGSGQTRVTDNPAHDRFPSWSPDGEKIVFTSYRYGNSDIDVMNADGSDQSRLVEPLYTVPESDRIDTVTFSTASTARGGVFSSNVWFSIPDSPLKLSDDDRLSVDVILPDGRTTQAADVRWAEGLAHQDSRPERAHGEARAPQQGSHRYHSQPIDRQAVPDHG